MQRETKEPFIHIEAELRIPMEKSMLCTARFNSSFVPLLFGAATG
jgi:hypothetical protein